MAEVRQARGSFPADGAEAYRPSPLSLDFRRRRSLDLSDNRVWNEFSKADVRDVRSCFEISDRFVLILLKESCPLVLSDVRNLIDRDRYARTWFLNSEGFKCLRKNMHGCSQWMLMFG